MVDLKIKTIAKGKDDSQEILNNFCDTVKFTVARNKLLENKDLAEDILTTRANETKKDPEIILMDLYRDLYEKGADEGKLIVKIGEMLNSKSENSDNENEAALIFIKKHPDLKDKYFIDILRLTCESKSKNVIDKAREIINDFN